MSKFFAKLIGAVSQMSTQVCELRNAEGGHSFGTFLMYTSNGGTQFDCKYVAEADGGCLDLDEAGAAVTHSKGPGWVLSQVAPGVHTIRHRVTQTLLSYQRGVLRGALGGSEAGTLWTIHVLDYDKNKAEIDYMGHFLRVDRSFMREADDCAPEILTALDKKSFVERGMLQKRGVVSRDLTRRAMRYINAHLTTLGKGMRKKRSDDFELFTPDLMGHSSITALLYSSPVWGMVQSLLGKRRAAYCDGGQIALRGPQLELCDNPELTAEHLKYWHIDGLEQNTHSEFTVLVGVSLTDSMEPEQGNFLCWPGSHKKVLPELKKRWAKGNNSQVYPDGKDGWGTTAVVGDEKGLQVLQSAGDVCIAHHKLCHAGGPNAGEDIRYMVYFRVRHTEHAKYKPGDKNSVLLSDLWVEFDGIPHSLRQ